ncbi:oligopeptide/dipeptide ABC transporter ATP-binding protein [Bauldia sp.]|uniref:oligopeptide/dipeptide ABC transporter ATP-binding protein n=1 Tax=Bauldia sp. TaxID=2575872 RepID=UPI003BAD4D9D
MQQLKRIQRENGSTLVLITHDMGVQAGLADRIAVLYAGRLVEEGDTLTIFEKPRHPYTQHLIGSLPTLDEKKERQGIPGRPPALDDPPAGCRFHPRCPLAMDICRTEVPPMTRLTGGHRAACHLITDEATDVAA